MPIPLGILAVAGAGAGAAGAYDLLETTVLSSSASSVTFSSLGSYSDYKNLQIRATARNNTGSGVASAFVRLNGDTGSNYAHHFLNGSFGSVSSSGESSKTNIFTSNWVASPALASGIYGAAVIDILDFSNTSKNKTLRTLCGIAITDLHISFSSGLWMNTNAITSVSITSNSGSFVAGSRFSLYGIR